MRKNNTIQSGVELQSMPKGGIRQIWSTALLASLIPVAAFTANPALADCGETACTLPPPTPPPACSVATSISSNFNGTKIGGGNSVWFNSVMKVKGLATTPVTVHLDNAVIEFAANGSTFSLNVPSASVKFDPAATQATTTFDSTTNTWNTVVPSNLGGNVFLDALSFPVNATLPGGINPVSWSGTLSSDTPGITMSWQWAAAIYTSFGTDYTFFNVKPTDDNKASVYQNSDHAGTSESYKDYVIGGARGGGGSNYTGSYSSTKSETCG